MGVRGRLGLVLVGGLSFLTFQVIGEGLGTAQVSAHGKTVLAAKHGPKPKAHTTPASKVASSCSLFTTAQVEAVLGSRVIAPKRSFSPHTSGGTDDSCEWDSATVTGEAFNVNLFYPYSASAFFAQYKQVDGYHAVPGVGSRAVTKKQATELDALKGDILLTIDFNVLQPNGFAEIAPNSQLERLGAEALSHLHG